MKFCENCGAELEDNAKFCDECGTIQNQMSDENQLKSSPKKKRRKACVSVSSLYLC